MVETESLQSRPGSAKPPKVKKPCSKDSAAPEYGNGLNRKASAVGSLCADRPDYIRTPPIEAVVFGWGVSEDGQLGVDTESDIKMPKVVEALLGTRLSGRNFLTTPLIGGSRSSLALDADGQILSWGWNSRATLGLGHMHEKVRKPRRVLSLSHTRIAQVAIGGWHCLAVAFNGQTFSWGGNEYSQCGLPSEQKDLLEPTRCVPDLKVVQVAAGGMHSCVLTDKGKVWTWGEPWGDFSMAVNRLPREVEGAENIAKIACGAFHNLALTQDGTVLAWGMNDFGTLGNGSTVSETQPAPVSGLENVRVADIAAGGWHSLALSADGEVFVWGRGEHGRLGLGDSSASSKLRACKVEGLEGHKVVQAACGGTHTMVLTDEGRIFAWGRASFGRLGGPFERNCTSPEEIYLPGGPDRWRVISVSCGGRHSLVLALPDNEASSMASNLTSRQNSMAEQSLASLPLGEPLLRSPQRSARSSTHIADGNPGFGEQDRARNRAGGASPQDLVSKMERLEAEEEAEAAALNGGVEPGSKQDFGNDEELGASPILEGDSPHVGNTRTASVAQLQNLLTIHGLRDEPEPDD